MMQRAISYISLFLSDFDIEDPDHDLAGFGDGGDYETRPVASVDSAMSTQHMAVSMSGTHITASISGTHASDSYDRVFELPNFELAHGQRIEEEGEEEEEEGQQQQQQQEQEQEEEEEWEGVEEKQEEEVAERGRRAAGPIRSTRRPPWPLAPRPRCDWCCALLRVAPYAPCAVLPYPCLAGLPAQQPAVL